MPLHWWIVIVAICWYLSATAYDVRVTRKWMEMNPTWPDKNEMINWIARHWTNGNYRKAVFYYETFRSVLFVSMTIAANAIHWKVFEVEATFRVLTLCPLIVGGIKHLRGGLRGEFFN